MPILLKHQPWNTDGTQTERQREIEWNMWRSRRPPFRDLDVGMPVVLISGSGPLAGTLTWQVEVVGVVKGPYSSHEEAWRLMQALQPLGFSKATFVNRSYTANAAEAGWLLGWAHRPVQQVMRLRNAGDRIDRNGWGATDQVRIGGGGEGNGGTGGQRYLTDPLLRRQVELVAMQKGYDWLLEQGLAKRSIRDTSADRPYDYEVGPADAPAFRVEVKGTTSGRRPVIVTPGEVKAACDGGVRTVLAVVHDVALTLRRVADGQPMVGRSGSTKTGNRPTRPLKRRSTGTTRTTAPDDSASNNDANALCWTSASGAMKWSIGGPPSRWTRRSSRRSGIAARPNGRAGQMSRSDAGRRRQRGSNKWYVQRLIATRPIRSLKAKILALTHRTSQQDLGYVLTRLNQVMHGWANYLRHAVAVAVLSRGHRPADP